MYIKQVLIRLCRLLCGPWRVGEELRFESLKGSGGVRWRKLPRSTATKATKGVSEFTRRLVGLVGWCQLFNQREAERRVIICHAREARPSSPSRTKHRVSACDVQVIIEGFKSYKGQLISDNFSPKINTIGAPVSCAAYVPSCIFFRPQSLCVDSVRLCCDAVGANGSGKSNFFHGESARRDFYMPCRKHDEMIRKLNACQLTPVTQQSDSFSATSSPTSSKKTGSSCCT
jgi:hypothetical protein